MEIYGCFSMFISFKIAHNNCASSFNDEDYAGASASGMRPHLLLLVLSKNTIITMKPESIYFSSFSIRSSKFFRALNISTRNSCSYTSGSYKTAMSILSLNSSQIFLFILDDFSLLLYKINHRFPFTDCLLRALPKNRLTLRLRLTKRSRPRLLWLLAHKCSF